MMFKPTKIIIHCSDSTWGSDYVIDSWHRERGFDENGYHKVILNGVTSLGDEYDIRLDGHIEDGRSITKQGAHCKGHNSDSIGICLIGVDEFTSAQYKSLKELCERLMEEYGISSDDIYGHNEFSTKTCPNFNVDDFVEQNIHKESTLHDMSSDIVTDEEMLDCMQTLRRFFKQ